MGLLFAVQAPLLLILAAALRRAGNGGICAAGAGGNSEAGLVVFATNRTQCTACGVGAYPSICGNGVYSVFSPICAKSGICDNDSMSDNGDATAKSTICG